MRMELLSERFLCLINLRQENVELESAEREE